MDNLNPSDRSYRMSLIRAKDTRPEMVVRQMAHRLGYRFRLHDSSLPGRPDLVFPRLGKIIFVHGCFWHRHPGCRLARLPKSKLDFWVPKLNGNRVRDLGNIEKLRRDGWRIKIVWECQTQRLQQLQKTLERFLGS
jgi:DNA mismatch endonuclease (patch repair protein)